MAWRNWRFEQNLQEGSLDMLEFDEAEAMITFPQGIKVCWGPVKIGRPGPENRVWWTYTHQETGDIWIARSDWEFTRWEHRERLLFVPSGSTNPAVVFRPDGHFTLTAEFLPAGTEQKEIWLYEPPYKGAGIRRIALGETPLIIKDFYGKLYLFYRDPDGIIKYRTDSDGFEAESIFTHSAAGDRPIGLRVPIYPINPPYHIQFQNAFFYGEQGAPPKYTLTPIEDYYTVGLTFIVIHHGRPLPGTRVKFNGETKVTNEFGQAIFLEVPHSKNLPYELTHPQHGQGAKAWFNVLYDFRGTHQTRRVEFAIPKPKENLGVQTGLTGIEWQGTIFEHEHQVEKLSPHINLGIEWESMLIPAYVLVYSGKQPIYGQVHLLTYTNPTTTSKRESFVWKSKGQISNQDVYVNIYTDGVKRPGIALRCSGSSGRENLYAGYYRHGTGNLEIAKYVNGTYTQLVAKSMTIQQGKWYSLRMQAEGSSIRLKIWDAKEPEPSNWALQTTDTSISNGYAGLWDFDGSGTSKWSNFSLNGEEADWETSDSGIPDGWSLQFGTASRWATETENVEVGFDYLVVPNATVQLGDQISQTNQEGLAPFQDLESGSLQDYEITHPDYPEISKGTVLIPEGEFDFIPLKIYEKPWDGYALEEVKVHADLDVTWVDIDIEYRQPKDSVSVSVGLTSILWVEVVE